MRLSEEQIRWFRLRRSGLAAGEGFADPETAAAALAGVQAQILPAAALALWNRSQTGAGTYAEFAARLHEARSILRLWGQRHTLHIYASADWPLLHAAFSARRTWWERQAARPGSGIDLAAYRAAIRRVGEVLRERGTLGRRDLRELGFPLPEGLLSPWGGVFAELTRIGLACHARWDAGEARYAHREHWLPALAWTPPPGEQADIALARRYFHAYGPSTVADLAYWRGATAAQARLWVQALAGELTQIEDPEGAPALALAADLPLLHAEPPPREDWPVRLLGRFDPLLLAHRRKDWVVPKTCYARVWRPAGHIEAIVLEHGRAVGTWRYDRTGVGKLAVTVFPFGRGLSARARQEARRQAKEVGRFFGMQAVEFTVVPAGKLPAKTPQEETADGEQA